MKPQFEDFDITKIGYVTKNQFTRLLKRFDLIPDNENQFNLLLKKLKLQSVALAKKILKISEHL